MKSRTRLLKRKPGRIKKLKKMIIQLEKTKEVQRLKKLMMTLMQ
nr:MAG TPA: hypothetical protein [Crassvirales sp.]DAU41535.1 MAG TPA: hypothetical protein [Bacteriophage sp.]